MRGRAGGMDGLVLVLFCEGEPVMEKEEVMGELEEGERMEEAGEVPDVARLEVVEMLTGRVSLKVEVVGEADGGVMVVPEEAVLTLIPAKDLKEEEEVGRERGLGFMEVGRRVVGGREAARRVWREEGWERGGAETEREQTLEEWPDGSRGREGR